MVIINYNGFFFKESSLLLVFLWLIELDKSLGAREFLGDRSTSESHHSDFRTDLFLREVESQHYYSILSYSTIFYYLFLVRQTLCQTSFEYVKKNYKKKIILTN